MLRKMLWQGENAADAGASGAGAPGAARRPRAPVRPVLRARTDVRAARALARRRTGGCNRAPARHTDTLTHALTHTSALQPTASGRS